MGRRGEGPIGVSIIERRGYQQSQRGGPCESITLVAGSDSTEWISIPCVEIKGQLPTVTLRGSFGLAQAPFICKIGLTTLGSQKSMKITVKAKHSLCPPQTSRPLDWIVW